MTPYFTIITPMLNGLIDVNGYIQSLQKQTFKDWEAIVIDDGSTDGSPEAIEKLVHGDCRFRITCNTRAKDLPGPYQARNHGLQMANGKYVCFLDIDDRWGPRKLEAQMTELKKNPHLKLLFSSYVRAKRGSDNGKVRHPLPLLSTKLWIHLANPVPMLTACVDRHTIAGIEFEPLYHEDYLFWHAVVTRLKPRQISTNTESLAIYYIHKTSISGNKLRGSIWIWKCYRRLGYNKALAAVAILCRALLQTWIKAQAAISPKTNL